MHGEFEYNGKEYIDMKQISTTNAPAAIGPYSQALTAGNMTFVSGQIPVNPATGEMPATIEEQATQALTNLKAVLAAAGLEMNNVIKTAVFLADLKDFPVVNRIYESFFEAPYPARSCVQVAGIPKGALVEIECIAVKE
jgi:2-iminobutanoate/2-iminopropanoate deaminase